MAIVIDGKELAKKIRANLNIVAVKMLTNIAYKKAVLYFTCRGKEQK